ncbi:hypothetical protein [Spirosoma radiotolerans]|uniref:Uncharacterized protein n=1 Tax=Spirosoma radiotolerans TaxID=1379870 RepID=A0A0E3V6S9_9BACT|nr:hypothetical protein [Spirosoma radiotolerans]AKD55287.1 hypothetical protein SD10_10615 [Spirosoma radiotolerans]
MPEPDKSIGRKILSFFVKDEEPGTATGTPPVASSAPVVPRPSASVPTPGVTSPGSVTPVGESPVSTPGTVDSKFAEHLANVLAQNNPPGPDYFEFRETLRSLSNLGLSEEKQFQAAWASFKALAGSVDVTVLTNTANGYIAALNKDRDGFAKSVETALAERVGGLQNEQKRLQTDNESLAKQLVEIQKQIDANTNRLTAITGEITEQSAKITQNRQNYETTFAHFTDQIKDDIAKMAHYLK